MPSTATVRSVHNQIRVGERDIFITVNDFEVAGTQILTHLGERRSDFNLLSTMFEQKKMWLNELNAFLILEEITILLDEMKEPKAVEVLHTLYRTLKKQVYAEGIAVIEMI